MKLVSVNAGLPREVTWDGKTVTTLKLASQLASLPDSWRDYFRKRLPGAD